MAHTLYNFSMKRIEKIMFLACIAAFFLSCSTEKNGKNITEVQNNNSGKTASADFTAEKNKKNSKKCDIEMQTPAGNVLCLEKAITPGERERGLMFREELKKGHGMIFFFDDDERKAFWMKNTLIPLDIIFLDENFTVMKVFENVPNSYIGAPEKEIPAVAWWGRHVLEIPGGSHNEYGINFGSRLIIKQR